MNTKKFENKCKCGPEFVCVRILENCDDLKIGNIYLPSSSKANQRLAHCIIEDVGSKSKEEYGLEVGDYVLIDRLSTFGHTSPIALLRYNNVIVKTNKDMTDFWPLKNMLFVEPDKNKGVVNNGGIYLINDADKLNLGTIVKTNFDDKLEIPFNEGDHVLLSNGADFVQLGTKDIFIYKHDMIIATVEN